MSVLEGNPPLLTDRAAELQDTSRTIEEVIDSLRGIVEDDKSRAIESLHGLADDVRGQLERIHERYDGTAHAIGDYAVELTAAHAEAEDAQDDLDAARTAAASAGAEVDAWQGAVDNAPADADTTTASDRLASARHDLTVANAAIQGAEEHIAQARHDVDEAASDAIARIEHAIADTNEGFWDKVGEFFDDVGDFFEALADWVADFFARVVDLLEELGATIQAILEALVVLALLVAVAAAVGPIALIAGLLLAGGLAAFIAWSVASDVGAPTPVVAPHHPGRKANRGAGTLDDVLYSTGEVDQLGGADESVVKITKRLGPDGWYYTVALPSTQEWLSRFGDDQGAVNDLDGNLALMMTPALDTQYERAVVEAMEQAGITADDHVMLAGFSQGGIMAGHLAAYNSELGIDAVVASGAPIDHMPIPDSVEVVSVQHDYDPVPRLDSLVGDGAPDHGANWTTIEQPAPGSPSPIDTIQIHNADQYADTLAAHVDEVRGNHPGLDTYFGSPTSTSYYSWSE